MEIGGSNGRRVQKRAARGEKKAEPKRNGFTREKKVQFLAHFSATCNAKASAREAGVAHTTVYAHRKSDPAFRAAWEEALEQGYARLEAELVRLSSEGLSVEADEDAADAAAAIDPKIALAELEAYRRNRGARPGEILPQVADRETARAKLEEAMIALKIIEAGVAGQTDPAIQFLKEGPSTASRSPSPGNPGEEK